MCHYLCYKIRHGIIIKYFVSQARLIFSMTRNLQLYCLINIIITLIFIILIFHILLTIIIHLLLLFSFCNYLVPTLICCRVFICNHELHFLLSGSRILDFEYLKNGFNILIQSPSFFHY